MKLAPFLLFAGLVGLAGCADLSRSAYRDSNSINKYSRRNMAATERNIPMAPMHPKRRVISTYADYAPSYYPSGSPYPPYPRRRARLTSEVVAPAYSPGLYGPVADAPGEWYGSGFGGRRYRYAPRYYGTPYSYGYYPNY